MNLYNKIIKNIFIILRRTKRKLFYFYIKLLYSFGKLGKHVVFGKILEIRNPKKLFIGSNIQILRGVILRPGKNKIIIGDYTAINPYTCIFGDVKIGKYCMIAPNVMIAGGNHDIDDISVPMMKSGKSTNKGIILEDDVWIGANSVILDGVKIEKGAVVAAGSIVTKSIVSYDIVAGNPARVINNRMKLK